MPDPSSLQVICGLLDRGEIDRVQFLERLTEFMSADIGCTRAAVRLLVQTDSGPAMRCLEMYDGRTGRSTHAPDMMSADASPYFDALVRDGSVVAPDCSAHAATQPYLANYLEPLDVRSLLDVAFSVNGVLYGSFSCEQVGERQDWNNQQLKRLRQVANRVSLTLMHAITSHIDTTPGALWEPSTPNRLMTMPMPLGDDDAQAAPLPR